MPADTKISRICVVGSANFDLTFRTARLPRAGETVAGLGLHTGCGGKGANQAVMAARLGAHVSMIAKIGGDAFGRQLAANFKDCGIDTTHVMVDESQPSGTAAIVVDDRAENCIIVVPGANQSLTAADVRAAAAVIRQADVVACQLEVPIETTIEAFRIARSAGVRTILNPAPVPVSGRLPDELFALTELLVPNETELDALLTEGGECIRDPESARRAARQLGVPRLLVTLGSDGALLADGCDTRHIPARKVSAVDPTGAGDCFIGSLAVFWAQGYSLQEAAAHAAAVAALSVTRPGAQASFPSRREVDAFITS